MLLMYAVSIACAEVQISNPIRIRSAGRFFRRTSAMESSSISICPESSRTCLFPHNCGCVSCFHKYNIIKRWKIQDEVLKSGSGGRGRCSAECGMGTRMQGSLRFFLPYPFQYPFRFMQKALRVSDEHFGSFRRIGIGKPNRGKFCFLIFLRLADDAVMVLQFYEKGKAFEDRGQGSRGIQKKGLTCGTRPTLMPCP